MLYELSARKQAAEAAWRNMLFTSIIDPTATLFMEELRVEMTLARRAFFEAVKAILRRNGS